MTGSGRLTPPAVWIGFALLAAAFALDFHFDVRDRDVFSWMDPYQYFDFPLAVLEGRERFDQFEIPSIFPFFVMPLLALSPSIPAALWVNVAFLPVLLFAIRGLCRELEIETPAPIVAGLALSSPILLGLSRSLYSEFALSALMALAFVSWLRFLKRRDLASGLVYGAAFAVALMTKLTLPVFMVLPVAGATIASLAEGNVRHTALILYTAALPIAAAVAIHALVFTPSLGYYATVASTSLPFMHLMGPVEVFSFASATYYLREIAETFLFLLTPFLLLAVALAGPRIRSWRPTDLASPRAAIWLWLLSPVLLLVLHPLKEPRHAAASAVPAVLLAVMGIEGLANAKARRAALAIAAALACLQYAAVTARLVDMPYFMDRPIHYAEIRDQIAAVDPREMYEQTPGDVRPLHWRYNQNVALAGFPPNEALALTWQSFPGVAFDLDTFDPAVGRFEAAPYESFEDLFFLAAINSYNRRSNWHRHQPTLARETVVANADLLILNDEGNGEMLADFPDHERFASVVREAGAIHLLRATRETVPYRAIYARSVLAGNPNLEESELHTLARELLMAATLDGDTIRARAIQREFHGVADGETPARNIYWIGGYPALIELAAAMEAEQPRSRPAKPPTN